jgi:DNA-binding Lrp family transcriptional regulator
VLANIGRQTGLRVIDLRLVEPFNIDLGFDLRGRNTNRKPPRKTMVNSPLSAADRCLLQALSSGLPLQARPFSALQALCGISEAAAIERTQGLVNDGVIARFGVIVRHRALGWRSNAMVVWQLPPEEASRAGPDLAAVPGVTLCYRRSSVPDVWPYTLYCMIHGRSREEVFAVLDKARALPALQGVEHEVLFSLRCFKQTGALISKTEKAIT